jgi:hypothetical protein
MGLFSQGTVSILSTFLMKLFQRKLFPMELKPNTEYGIKAPELLIIFLSNTVRNPFPQSPYNPEHVLL